MLHQIEFLKDVFVLSISGFGGAQAHLALMLDILVKRKRYVTEEELIEVTALCQMLPGPSSTQIITAIGHKLGGSLLALLTLLIWVLPAASVMTLITIMFGFFQTNIPTVNFLKYLQPVAIGIIWYAGYKISRTVIHTPTGVVLLILSTLSSILIRSPWIFPIGIVAGGIISNFTHKEKGSDEKHTAPINWWYLAVFAGIFLIAGLMSEYSRAHHWEYNRAFSLFENFYRFGSLVFGGGQVLVPMMYEQFVSHRHYLTSQEFISGFGIVQMMPGPVFSFATFTGGMALKEWGMGFQLLGCLIGTIAIFLPGTLIIFFVYPFWEYLKNYAVVKRALEGINACSSGFVLAAAVILSESLHLRLIYFLDDTVFYGSTQSWISVYIVILTFLILKFTKIPAPILVVGALIAGFL